MHAALRIPDHLLALPTARKLLFFNERAGLTFQDHAHREGERIDELSVYNDLGGETTAWVATSSTIIAGRVGTNPQRSITLATPAHITALVALMNDWNIGGDEGFHATVLRDGIQDPDDLMIMPIRECYGADHTLTFGRLPPAPAMIAGTWKLDDGFPYIRMAEGDSSYLETGQVAAGEWAQGTVAMLHRCPTAPSAAQGLFSDRLPKGQVSVDLVGVAATTLYEFNLVDGVGSTVLSSAGGSFGFSSAWHLVAVDWGPLGMRIIKNGEVIASNTNTKGSALRGDTLQANIYGGAPIVYGNMDVAFFGAWEEQFPVAVHRRMQEGRRRP